MDKTEVVILVGSNHRRRGEYIAAAIGKLSTVLDGFGRSPVVELPDVSGKGAPYLNAVCRGDTRMSLDRLTAITKRIEEESGRTAASKQRGEVELDIDIVMWGGAVIRPLDAASDYFTIPLSMLDSENSNMCGETACQ